jgi:hypothetical protein
MAFGRRRATKTAEAAEAPASADQTAAPDPTMFEAIPGGTDEPCTPCEAARRARQFSLNPPEPTPVADDTVPAVAELVVTDVGDDGVDLSIDGQGPAYSLNATAGLIWLTIDGRLDVAGIIADLALETGVPADQIAPDVRGSVATFAAQGLVTLTIPG